MKGEEGSEVRLNAVLVLRPPKVMVVEDDPDMAELFRSVLREIDPDVEVHVADKVIDAQAWLSENDADLVLADYMLGDEGSGFAMRGWMERHQPDVAFAMTSSVDPEIYAEMSGADPSPFLGKPFSVAECKTFLLEMLADRQV